MGLLELKTESLALALKRQLSTKEYKLSSKDSKSKTPKVTDWQRPLDQDNTLNDLI